MMIARVNKIGFIKNILVKMFGKKFVGVDVGNGVDYTCTATMYHLFSVNYITKIEYERINK